MFELVCKITIGGYQFDRVNHVSIKRSIYNLMAEALIKVPATALLRRKGESITRVETAKNIRVGDSVSISLGYNGRLTREFTGYVKAINLKTPIEIECEDQFYQCRSMNITTFGKISLRDLLSKCGLEVAVAEELTLSNFVIKEKSVAFVLSRLQTDYGLTIFFDLEKKIYACRRFGVVGDKVKYELRRNVINDDSLQFHRKEDTKIEIKAICFKKDGSKVEAVKGEKEGSTKTLYFYNVEDMKELAALAEKELERYSFDGYQGQIETFLLPMAIPGMIAEVKDPFYAQRDGDYYIESVETTFGTSGARRKIEIGIRV